MASNPFPEDKWIRANDLNLHYLDWGGDRTRIKNDPLRNLSLREAVHLPTDGPGLWGAPRLVAGRRVRVCLHPMAVRLAFLAHDTRTTLSFPIPREEVVPHVVCSRVPRL